MGLPGLDSLPICRP